MSRARQKSDRLRWILRGDDDSDDEKPIFSGSMKLSSNSGLHSYNGSQTSGSREREIAAAPDVPAYKQEVLIANNGLNTVCAVSSNALSLSRSQKTNEWSPVNGGTHGIYKPPPFDSEKAFTPSLSPVANVFGQAELQNLQTNALSPHSIRSAVPFDPNLQNQKSPVPGLNGHATKDPGPAGLPNVVEASLLYPFSNPPSPPYRGASMGGTSPFITGAIDEQTERLGGSGNHSPRSQAERVGAAIQRLLRSDLFDQDDLKEPIQFSPSDSKGNSNKGAQSQPQQEEMRRRQEIMYASDDDDRDDSGDESGSSVSSEPCDTAVGPTSLSSPSPSKSDRLAFLMDGDGAAEARVTTKAGNGIPSSAFVRRRSRTPCETDGPTIQFSRRSATPPAARGLSPPGGSIRPDPATMSALPTKTEQQAKAPRVTSSDRHSPPTRIGDRLAQGYATQLSPPTPPGSVRSCVGPSSQPAATSRSPDRTRPGAAPRPPPARTFASADIVNRAGPPPAYPAGTGLSQRLPPAAARFSPPSTRPLPAVPGSAVRSSFGQGALGASARSTPGGPSPRPGDRTPRRRTLTPRAHSRLAARLLDDSESDSDNFTTAAERGSPSDTDTDSYMWAAAAPTSSQARTQRSASASVATGRKQVQRSESHPGDVQAQSVSVLRNTTPPHAQRSGERFAGMVAANGARSTTLSQDATPYRYITTPAASLKGGSPATVTRDGDGLPAALRASGARGPAPSPPRVGPQQSTSPPSQRRPLPSVSPSTARSAATSLSPSPPSAKASHPPPLAAMRTQPPAQRVTQARGAQSLQRNVTTSPIPSLRGSDASGTPALHAQTVNPSRGPGSNQGQGAGRAGNAEASLGRGRASSALRRWQGGESALYQHVRAMLDSDDEGN